MSTELLNAINAACGIIGLGGERLLASDGPAGGQPPALTLDEWRRLYVVLDTARRAASTLLSEPDAWGALEEVRAALSTFVLLRQVWTDEDLCELLDKVSGVLARRRPTP